MPILPILRPPAEVLVIGVGIANATTPSSTPGVGDRQFRAPPGPRCIRDSRV